MAGYQQVDESFATRAIHEAQEPDQWRSRAVVPPITMSATYKVDEVEFPDYFLAKQFHYGRMKNPNREVLERCVASLDNAKYAVCLSSGMAALSNLLRVVQPGDHVLGAKDAYGGTIHYLSTAAKENGLETDLFNPLDLKDLQSKLRPNTKMVWIESLSNPSTNVVDMRRIAEVCRQHSPELMLVVDNSYLTSYFQKPLDLGASAVMYSISKYMNGHSDVIMGAIVTNSDKIHERLRFLQNYVGSIPSPFDCYLVTRGLKTLAVRMREHMNNSMHVAKFLQQHKLIEKVLHPGLECHPQHELYKSQCSGYGGMMSFFIRGATIEQVLKFMRALKIVQFAGSFGGPETLISSPVLMSHAVVSAEERQKLGVTDNMVRLAVGLEEATEICNDLHQALTFALS